MKYITFLLPIVLLTSCKVMYRPTLQHVPMFSKKGELQITATDKNAEISYAVTPSIGLVASGYYRNRHLFTLTDGKSSNYKGYQRSISLAAGYYKVHPRGSFEIFGGYGKGYSSLFFGSSDGPSGAESNVNLFFIQPNIIVGDRDKRAAYGFSCRIMVVNFYDFKDVQQFVPSPQSPGFIEPAITFRMKFGLVAFKGQAMLSWSLDHPKEKTNYYDPYTSMVSINGGLELHISDLFRKK